MISKLAMASVNLDTDADMYALTECIRNHFSLDADAILPDDQISSYLQDELKMEEPIETKILEHAMHLVFGDQVKDPYGYHVSIQTGTSTVIKEQRSISKEDEAVQSPNALSIQVLEPKTQVPAKLSPRQMAALRSKQLHEERKRQQDEEQQDQLMPAPSHPLEPSAPSNNSNSSETEDEESELHTEPSSCGEDRNISKPETVTDSVDKPAMCRFFGDHSFRCIYSAISLFICSIFSFSMWFKPTSNVFSLSYGLSGFGAICTFIASAFILSYFCIKAGRDHMPTNECLKISVLFFEYWLFWTIKLLGLLGGFFYFLGGCAVAYSWDESDREHISGGVFFAEQSFVGFFATITAMDLWRSQYLDDKKKRVFVYNVAFVIFVFVAFCSYASISINFDNAGIFHVGPAFLTLFYFLLLIGEILYLTIYFVPKLKAVFYKTWVWLALT